MRLVYIQKVVGSSPIPPTRRGVKRVTKERREIIEGIIYAIGVMKLLPVEGLSKAEAVVLYGKDDKVTLGEAEEVLMRKEAA